MPRKPKSAAAAASSEKASGSTNTASAVNLQANSPWGSRRQVVKTMARREMSTQAKELFRDADAAQKFFTKFKKETEEIQWFPRPAGPQCCKNFADCNCAEAMFWCHPCGFAYCLECRTCGLACNHNTSSTAQGGGGSFKNRKPIGEVGCCESGMAERSH